MPILIKGSGGAQKAPTISVNSSGLITATAGKKSVTKQLSSNDDADFVSSNIGNGKEIFGVTGTYGRVADISSATLNPDTGILTITLNEPIAGVLGGGLYDLVKKSASGTSADAGLCAYFDLIITRPGVMRIQIFEYWYEDEEFQVYEYQLVNFSVSSDGTKIVTTETIDADLLHELDYFFTKLGGKIGATNCRLIVY